MKYYFLALGTLFLVCVGCAFDGRQILDNGNEKGVYNAPPAERMLRPGPMVDGPGPGVMPMLASPAPPAPILKVTQVRFVGPAGMQIGWQVPGPPVIPEAQSRPPWHGTSVFPQEAPVASGDWQEPVGVPVPVASFSMQSSSPGQSVSLLHPPAGGAGFWVHVPHAAPAPASVPTGVDTGAL